MKYFSLGVLALALAFSTVAKAEEAAGKKEKWEITIRSEGEGSEPSVMTMTQCMDAMEAKSQAIIGNQNGEEGTFEASMGDCSIKGKNGKNSAHFEQKCKNGESNTITSEFTDGHFINKTISTSADGKKSTATIEGKRLGGC